MFTVHLSPLNITLVWKWFSSSDDYSTHIVCEECIILPYLVKIKVTMFSLSPWNGNIIQNASSEI